MFCSSCGRTFEGPACPVCLTSDLDDFGASVKWEGRVDWGDSSDAEAKIVGPVTEDWDTSVVPGARATPDGRVASFLFYVPKSPARMVRSSAVPVMVEYDPTRSLTPFESALVKHIDGEKTVRELAEASGLAPRDVVSTIISLVDSGAVKLKQDEEPPPAAKRAGPPLLKAPIQERVRKPKADPPVVVGTPVASAPIGQVRMSFVPQAQMLFEQGMKDRAQGNLVSAQMNFKLALTYDRDNEELKAIVQGVSAKPAPSPAAADPKAMALFQEAAEAETNNNIVKAIELLEKAIELAPQAAFYNRLGVILATRRREFDRGRALISRAVDLEPANKTYRQNLENLAPPKNIRRP